MTFKKAVLVLKTWSWSYNLVVLLHHRLGVKEMQVLWFLSDIAFRFV